MSDLYLPLKAAAEKLDEAEFVRRHGGWYIFCRMPDAQVSTLPFVTQLHTISADGKLPPEPDKPAPAERIWRVEKSPRNSWRGRISVGRATNNDIVIRHESVSKLHAHFTPATTEPTTGGPPPSYLLTDAGSSNGTEVNDTTLTADVPAPIRNRDRVAFGLINGRFLDAATLRSELNSLDWF